MIISMKKTILTLALLLGISLSLFAQREIPMFFDRDMGLTTSSINNVTYSHDGNKVAVTFGNNRKIAIWDAASGKELARLAGHSEPITNIVFSSNDRQLASCAEHDSTVKIWDTLSGTLIRSITQSGVWTCAFSPDGSRIAGVYFENNVEGIKIWNTVNGNEIRTLIGHTDMIWSVAYSPDGKQIITASDDGTIRIWDAGNGQAIRTINGEASFGKAVYSPDGRYIAVHVINAKFIVDTVRIYNAATGQEVRSIPVVRGAGQIAYNHDSRQLLINILDDNNNLIIKIFDPDTGRELRSFNSQNEAVAYSTDGKKILTNSSAFLLKIGDTYYRPSYAGILDATTGRTIGMIGYGPLNVGAKAFADLQIARFLGDTAAVGRHEAVLKFITDKGYATRQEIEAFYRDNVRAQIAGVVDEEFNKISFMLSTDTDGFNAVLVRRENQYTLTCDGFWGMPKKEEVRVFSGSSLDDLIKKMQESKNFKEQYTTVWGDSTPTYTYLRARTALIPAVALSDAALNEIKTILTNFFITPNTTTYNAVKEVYMLYTDKRVETGREIYELIRLDYLTAQAGLSAGLVRKVAYDENYSITTLSADQQKKLLQLR